MTRTRKLNREYLTKYSCMMMNDETYVLEDFLQLPDMAFYTVIQRNDGAEHIRTKKKAKLPKKIFDLGLEGHMQLRPSKQKLLNNQNSK